MNQILNFLLSITDTSNVPVYEGLVSPPVPSFVGMTFRSIAALCLVVGIMFILVWGLRKVRSKSSTIGGLRNNEFIKVLGRSYLNSKQSIYLVEVACTAPHQNRILILGVSGESINMLSEIKDSETVKSIKKSADNKSFSGHLHSTLSRFIPKFNHSKVLPTSRFAESQHESAICGDVSRGSGLWD